MQSIRSQARKVLNQSESTPVKDDVYLMQTPTIKVAHSEVDSNNTSQMGRYSSISAATSVKAFNITHGSLSKHISLMKSQESNILERIKQA